MYENKDHQRNILTEFRRLRREINDFRKKEELIVVKNTISSVCSDFLSDFTKLNCCC